MWGGIAVLGALLLGLLIYVKACEEPIEGFAPATETELLAIAEENLGDRLATTEWSGSTDFTVEQGVLLDSLQEAVDLVLDESPFPSRFDDRVPSWTSLLRLRSTEEDHQVDAALDTRARMALVRAIAVSDQEFLSIRALRTSDVTNKAVATASNIDQWMQTQTARLLFLRAMSVTRFSRPGLQI